MKIGIDIRAAGASALLRGDSGYLQGLAGGLLAIDSANEYHIFANHPSEAAHLVDGRPNVRVVTPASVGMYAAWHRLDVVQCGRDVPALVGAAAVAGVPEISFESYPRDFTARELKFLSRARRGCRHARLVLTGSSLAQRQLHEKYGLPLEKIVVAPAAADHVSDRAGFTRTPASLGLPERYVVFASGTRLKDNLPRMLAAFDQLVSRIRIPHYLVIPARRGETPEGFEYALRLMKNRSRVLVFRNLTEADLHVALRSADVFACPSLYDGPGVTPMLAQRLDLPCLVSRTGSFPEIYGDSVLYCDPLDPASIAAGVERLLREPLLRSELTLRAAERIRRCSWRHAAAIALDAYRRLTARKLKPRSAAALLEA